MTGATCGAGDAYPSGAPDFTSGFYGDSCCVLFNEVGQSNKKVYKTCGRYEISTELSNGRTKCVQFGLPVDCQDIKDSNAAAHSASYLINPNGATPMEVYCDMDTEGGGWTVFQSKQDGSVDFFRTWKEYKTGFGNVSGEFWLGDSARYMNGLKFSTKDADHDKHSSSCSMAYKGGWWYKHCHHCNLNGLYYHQPAINAKGVVWRGLKGSNYSLKTVTMKVKRN